MPAGSVAALIAASMAGVLTALTPGLYPLIPITVLTFGQGLGRRLMGVLAYAVGLASVLALACALAAGVGRLAAEPLHTAAGYGFLTLVCVGHGRGYFGPFPGAAAALCGGALGARGRARRLCGGHGEPAGSGPLGWRRRCWC